MIIRAASGATFGVVRTSVAALSSYVLGMGSSVVTLTNFNATTYNYAGLYRFNIATANPTGCPTEEATYTGHVSMLVFNY